MLWEIERAEDAWRLSRCPACGSRGSLTDRHLEVDLAIREFVLGIIPGSAEHSGYIHTYSLVIVSYSHPPIG